MAECVSQILNSLTWLLIFLGGRGVQYFQGAFPDIFHDGKVLGLSFTTAAATSDA